MNFPNRFKKPRLVALPLACALSGALSIALSGAVFAAGYRVTPSPEVQPGMTPKEAQYVKALQHVKVPPPPASMKAPDKARVRLETSKGSVIVELNGKAAPLHVKSFLYLAKKGFFDKTAFHRYAELMGPGQGRIIQGGDPLTKVPSTREFGGMGGPGYQIPREHNALKHDAMVIAAARSQSVDSAGSQFYLTFDPTYFLDTSGGGYTVFGKVVAGKDVVLKLRQGDILKKVVILTK